jgi:hypothetical protein
MIQFPGERRQQAARAPETDTLIQEFLYFIRALHVEKLTAIFFIYFKAESLKASGEYEHYNT